jgi:divalent metal cation (Fe/Co/Zn/Cd) transporter
MQDRTDTEGTDDTGRDSARHPDPGDDRDETASEKADRKFADVLQELRVVQTGAQLTAGFLLTLPFQDRFWTDLGDGQRRAYLALVLLAAVITSLVMVPVAIHRRLSGRHVKQRVVDASHLVVRVVLALMGLLVAGIAAFVFDVVVDRTSALVVGGALLALLTGLLVVLPRTLVDGAEAE